ncbi:MAG: AmmeMemoRadiSam system radical SAM enzyme [Candidatus Aminicenantes bacterium]|nr:AmmeMemoRadiSam system radical SAM enzyme [Candidatus Aminicenantes bacterium]
MRKEAYLYKQEEGTDVSCFLCSHRCRVAESKFGVCGVRQNRGGKLYTHVYGAAIAAHVDPIEKKPLYHFLPGSISMSIATIGCNFHCPFCQNWQISQTRVEKGEIEGKKFPPQDVVAAAKKYDCRSISYTYTEPTIFFEYAYDTAKIARAEGLANVFVTNGYMTAEALRMIKPYLDACNVDLKAFRETFYKKMCGAKLQPVCDSIRLMKELGIWVEVTTLVVPGQNDSDGELRDIARFIAGTGKDVPWHISRYHPDYEFDGAPPTPIKTLRRAYGIGKEEGLNFVYIGNVVGESENTLCPSCGKTVIRRGGFSVSGLFLKDSSCPECGAKIPGVFLFRLYK